MTNIISGFGGQIYLVASQTFPIGFSITQWADDADPLDFPSIPVSDAAMGVNGDLIVWSSANPIPIGIAVIPTSQDDINLSILLEANRPGRGKKPIKDIITLTVTYPDGTIRIANNGAIMDGMPGNSVASAGRQKTKVYQFKFENIQ